MSPKLFDFRTGGEPWTSIDDRVMGGRSQSRFELGPGFAVFGGVVSLADGGGFASVRSPVFAADLREWAGLAVRIRGDGKTYALRLRDSDAFDGVSYQATLVAEPGAWQEVRLPFAAFRPVFRGREVPDAPRPDLGRVCTLGWMIASRQAGRFRLEIEWIGGWI